MNPWTLEQYNRLIALTVLEQEDYNQTRTAARLGISRSTLWRMLKSHEESPSTPAAQEP